ncbi:MAG TPA: tRNA glutamyl-Q(34) synthetase GluQRS [Methylophilaceae bacterium]|nr:tRNA glutamyl-Q(34) synthetase GluQRS [Methylophilaceae bacterium]
MARAALLPDLALMYRGRFAPSPTGPLHLGSLIAAVASFLEAKIHDGQWLVRMEDLDKSREMPGAADDILKTLEIFGFEWDETVIYQSSRNQVYQHALEQLQHQHLVYPCACSRKEIADSANRNPTLHGLDGLIYPGTCRYGLTGSKSPRYWRITTDDGLITFDDAIQGHFSHDLSKLVGDFVLKRADGFYAYQLAVVVDDAEQGITHVVRGADLLDSTSRQIYLQQKLGFPTPAYAHVPAATNAKGEKLSKQTLAPSLNKQHPAKDLWLALDFLGQNPLSELKTSPIADIWQWARQHWDLSRIPRVRFKEF